MSAGRWAFLVVLLLLLASVIDAQDPATKDAKEEEGSGEGDDNVKLAVILSIGSGLATTIGGAAVFVPSIRKFSQPSVLASALALSSGVMLYVSFVEILVKANDAITVSLGNGYNVQKGEDMDGEEFEGKLGFTYPGDKFGNLYTTFAFFGGMLIVVLLDFVVHKLSPAASNHDIPEMDNSPGSSENSSPNEPITEEPQNSRSQQDMTLDQTPQQPANTSEAPKEDPAATEVTTEQIIVSVANAASDIEDKTKKELKKMGLLTALALGLHNFPEGFATFIATLSEPSLGFALAVAIAIHNIPEGLCVAMPVYYATGSKWKGFGWSFFSGLTEPLGGILGWLALRSVFTDAVFGASFGAVGGMMVYIVLHELLPTAHRNDPTNKYVTKWLVVGMVVIAASLIAFAFA